jgi:hypothetical protein
MTLRVYGLWLGIICYVTFSGHAEANQPDTWSGADLAMAGAVGGACATGAASPRRQRPSHTPPCMCISWWEPYGS